MVSEACGPRLGSQSSIWAKVGSKHKAACGQVHVRKVQVKVWLIKKKFFFPERIIIAKIPQILKWRRVKAYTALPVLLCHPQEHGLWALWPPDEWIQASHHELSLSPRSWSSNIFTKHYFSLQSGLDFKASHTSILAPQAKLEGRADWVLGRGFWSWVLVLSGPSSCLPCWLRW